MWRDPNKFTAVSGKISPNGWCEWFAGGAYGKHGKRVAESLNVLSQWKNEEPVSYVKQLTKFFKNPDELTNNRAIWHNKDGFKRIEVLDEYILHASPSPHYDYVYSYVDIKVPHDLSDDLAKSSESILIDHLKGEVGARCASLSANAVTIQYVLDVVENNVKPSKVEYEKRIKSMKKMFADGKRFKLDWWPDTTGDTDPKNTYYKESKLNHNIPFYEDGRIIKGVNTTVDVGTNEIKKQAAKFGNKVDRDGRPPLLSKKVKGPKTNVLFNLGLAENQNKTYTDLEMAIMEGGHSLEDLQVNEGIKLQLERDSNMLVLHIKDTKTGHRTEVRGKPGYEVDGYDTSDPLHQLLDKIGKAANISDLMNGEVVSINPTHPLGPDAISAAKKIANEQFLDYSRKDKLNEKWKDALVGAGLGLGVALGSPTADAITVKPNDTIYDIARQVNSTPEELKKLNNLDPSFTIWPGQKLKVPGQEEEIPTPRKRPDTLSGTDNERFLTKMAKKAGITDPTELAAFLAQTAHETRNFSTLEEDGDSDYFKMYDIRYNPEKADELGNIKPGDGVRYKGRGFLQITGRYNYRKYGDLLGLPLEKKPKLLENPKIAARASLLYWKDRVQPNVNDFNNVSQVTKPINPKLKNIEERKKLFQRYKKFLEPR